MKITLKSATLVNFKKIKFLQVTFNFLTNVFGANETGKTTIFDSILWVLFGKNSQDQKDFSIKTLDENNNAIPKLDHEVSIVLEVDGIEMNFRRVYKEKWVKKRGEAETEFSGHETTFFCNDVPLSQAEYQAKIDSILKENVFKMITSPSYFNSMKWQDRRSILFEIAGNITNIDIASGKPDFEHLLAKIGSMDMVEYKKGITARKKKLKEELDLIPTRIDEISRNPIESQDWNALILDLDGKKFELVGIEKQIFDLNESYRLANESQVKTQNEIFSLKQQMQKIESAARLAAEEGKNNRDREIILLKRDISDKEADLKTFRKTIEDNKNKIESLAADRQKLLDSWHAENGKQITFDDSEFNCPTCKRPFDADDIEAKKSEMIASFNTNKKKITDGISYNGHKVKANMEALIKENSDTEPLIDSLEKEIAILTHRLKEYENPDAIVIVKEVDLTTNAEYQSLKVKVADMEATLGKITPLNNEELINRRNTLSAEINEINKKLSLKSVIDQNNSRLKGLDDQEKSLAQQIADLEKTEFTIEKFTKAKIEAVEEKINSKFRYVKFKMYKQNINGGEEECCETLYNGVPFSDLNTAGRILTGLDIINTLSKHYDVYCPVFLDNRESTTDIPEMDCQIINLYVSPEDKTLRIA